MQIHWKCFNPLTIDVAYVTAFHLISVFLPLKSFTWVSKMNKEIFLFTFQLFSWFQRKFQYKKENFFFLSRLCTECVAFSINSHRGELAFISCKMDYKIKWLNSFYTILSVALGQHHVIFFLEIVLILSRLIYFDRFMSKAKKVVCS